MIESATNWREYEAVYGKHHTVTGRVVVLPRAASPELGGERDILVYLPPSLAKDWRDDEPAATATRRYPTLYFNDGENVFDERTAYVKEEWRADETLEALAKDGIEAIAVAIPNGREQRMDEYNPWRSTLPWKNMPAWATRREMGGKGDAYLDYLANTVKPLIDRSFPTAADPANTAIVGSSMGGLISLYAVVARPDVFRLGGVFSPSLPWSNYRMLELLRERGLAEGVRLYVDIGLREGRQMTADARKLRKLLLEMGFAEGPNLRYVEERGGIHRESAWARRLPEALRFLLARRDGQSEQPTTD